MSISKLPVAIVTGGTKGIGRGIVDSLAKKGFAVVITSRDKTNAQNYSMYLRDQGFDSIGMAFNLENRDDTNQLIENTIQHYGRLDTLVNNTISSSCVPNFDNMSADEITFAITSNITNTLLLTKSAYPFLKQKSGNIVNIGSVAVNRPVLGMVLYTMIKGAIIQMTKALAAEWAKDKIRVNCINPGFFYSSALEDGGVPREMIDKIYSHCERFHPLGNKIGDPAEIGNLVAFIASDSAKIMTGSIIDFDAGMSIQGISIQPEN